MAATYAGKLVTAEHDGALCFFSCPQGVDDYLIQNNLSIAAAIDGNYLVYVPIEEQAKTLVFDDGSSITSEDCIDVSRIPSDATFVIVNEPAFYWKIDSVVFGSLINTDYMLPTYHGKLVYTSSNGSWNSRIIQRETLEQAIQDGLKWSQINLTQGPSIGSLRTKDGLELTPEDIVNNSKVPADAVLSISTEIGYSYS